MFHSIVCIYCCNRLEDITGNLSYLFAALILIFVLLDEKFLRRIWQLSAMFY